MQRLKQSLWLTLQGQIPLDIFKFRPYLETWTETRERHKKIIVEFLKNYRFKSLHTLDI